MSETLIIPYPPTVNTYWRNVNGRAILSKRAREYRSAIGDLARLNHWSAFGSKRLQVRLEVWPPDKRRRDLDNLPKAVFDALTHVGVWDDDSQIDLYTVERMPVAGHCVVHIQERAC